MLLAAVLSPDVAEALRALTEDDRYTFSHLSSRTRDAAVMLADLDVAGRAAADVLLLDVDAGPVEAMLDGLDRYRLARPAVRVVVLAAGRQPGDSRVAQLVAMGAGDVINAELGVLAEAVGTVLSRPPAGYAEMRRWRTLGSLAVPAAETRKKVEATPETIRVLAQDQRRTWTIVVAGADRAAGTTELAWNLALTMARQGLQVALLADLPAQTAQVVEAAMVPPGVKLGVLPYEREPAPLASQKDREAFQPPDRVRFLLELSGRADVAVVDVGNLAEALVREPQVLAVSQRSLVCWPQGDVRLQTILSTLAGRKPAWSGYLPQATHVAYLVPSGKTAAATADLAAGIQAAVGLHTEFSVVPVPVGPNGVEMGPLINCLAPRQSKGMPRRRELLAALHGGEGGAAVALAGGRFGGLGHWGELALSTFYRVAPFFAVLWLAGGVAAYFNLPIPDWWPGARGVAALLRSALAVIVGSGD